MSNQLVTFDALPPATLAGMTFNAIQRIVVEGEAVVVNVSMRVAVAVKHIHDKKRFTEAGFDTFAEWCEAIDRTKKWGHELVRAAEHEGRVENVGQARALKGLPPAEADAVVAIAKSAGPVTAAALTEFREERSKAVGGFRKAAQDIAENVAVRKAKRLAEKLRLEMQKTTVFTERDYADVERIIGACNSQLDEAA